MQSARNVLKKYIHRFSTSHSNNVLEHLKTRSLLRVSGNDATSLLQGLITNDMQHLSHGVGSMFAMFLNNKGRVLYDTIIYRTPAENTYYVEVDKQATDLLKKHLKIYCLRRKIDITSIDDQFKIWVHFDPSVLTANKQNTSEDNLLEGKIVPCTVLGETLPDNNVTSKSVGGHEILVYQDPRLSLLGSRIIAQIDSDAKVTEIFQGTSELTYNWFRYRLGVGEGIEELPIGNCFPLEANCDYLHGVSFHKGCYIGQELTARTHHTGVVRKRLMPLILETAFSKNPEKDEIVRSGEANVGKLRGFESNSALGLLRIAPALEAEQLVVNNTVASTIKPQWWPHEASKEKVSSRKL